MLDWLGGQPLVFDDGRWGNIALSVCMAFFAVVVGGLGRFRGAAGWYAIFGLSFAASTIASNFLQASMRAVEPIGTLGIEAAPSVGSKAWILGSASAAGSAAVVWAMAAVRLQRHYGVRHSARDPAAWVFVVLMVGSFSAGFLAAAGWSTGIIALAVAFYAVATGAAMGLMAYGAFALARCYARDRDPSQAVLAAAFAVYPILNAAGAADAFIAAQLPVAYPLTASAVALAVIVAWLRAREATRKRAPGRVAAMLAFVLAAGVPLGIYVPDAPLPGIARAIDVVLVGYAILRLHYLDIDVKLRWGISKTTLAATFVAVFFIVSEGAAAFFSDRWGTGLGIVAAGALVFGIAPLMRWADRVAASAVPPRSTAEATYLHALRVARADGRLSAAEEDELAKLADSLGLGVSTVRDLRRRPRAAGRRAASRG